MSTPRKPQIAYVLTAGCCGESDWSPINLLQVQSKQITILGLAKKPWKTLSGGFNFELKETTSHHTADNERVYILSDGGGGMNAKEFEWLTELLLVVWPKQPYRVKGRRTGGKCNKRISYAQLEALKVQGKLELALGRHYRGLGMWAEGRDTLTGVAQSDTGSTEDAWSLVCDHQKCRSEYGEWFIEFCWRFLTKCHTGCLGVKWIALNDKEKMLPPSGRSGCGTFLC